MSRRPSRVAPLAVAAAATKSVSLELVDSVKVHATESLVGALTRAELDSLSPSGEVLIRVDGELRTAAIAASCSEAELLAAIRNRGAVLVGFLDGNRARPVILGLLRDRLQVERVDAAVREPSSARERVLTLSASEIITLRCGEAQLELRADGRVAIRGVDIVSIAEGTQRILGGNVGIN